MHHACAWGNQLLGDAQSWTREMRKEAGSSIACDNRWRKQYSAPSRGEEACLDHPEQTTCHTHTHTHELTTMTHTFCVMALLAMTITKHTTGNWARNATAVHTFGADLCAPDKTDTLCDMATQRLEITQRAEADTTPPSATTEQPTPQGIATKRMQQKSAAPCLKHRATPYAPISSRHTRRLPCPKRATPRGR